MTVHSGTIMSDESKKEWEQAFIDIEESIQEVMKNGVDL